MLWSESSAIMGNNHFLWNSKHLPQRNLNLLPLPFCLVWLCVSSSPQSSLLLESLLAECLFVLQQAGWDCTTSSWYHPTWPKWKDPSCAQHIHPLSLDSSPSTHPCAFLLVMVHAPPNMPGTLQETPKSLSFKHHMKHLLAIKEVTCLPSSELDTSDHET